MTSLEDKSQLWKAHCLGGALLQLDVVISQATKQLLYRTAVFPSLSYRKPLSRFRHASPSQNGQSLLVAASPLATGPRSRAQGRAFMSCAAKVNTRGRLFHGCSLVPAHTWGSLVTTACFVPLVGAPGLEDKRDIPDPSLAPPRPPGGTALESGRHSMRSTSETDLGDNLETA